MRKRIITILFFLLLIVHSMVAMVAAAPLPPAITAEAAYLMAVGNNGPDTLLFGKNPDKIMYPASTTKIMTLLLALEKGDLDSVVTVSPKAAGCEESRLGLEAGNQLTLRELLKGMMAVSGNDAAEAAAEHIGGSVADFADMMNAKAKELGAKNTHFSNPHGLPDENHVTSAHDLAIITAYALKQPGFIDYVASSQQTVTFIQPAITITVHNTNKLLKTYWGANGVKTGTTEAAGNCLVASAKRGNIQLLAVVLKADDTVEDCRWQDAASLLDYGFAVLAAKK